MRIKPVYYQEFKRRLHVFIGRYAQYVEGQPSIDPVTLHAITFTSITYDYERGIMSVNVPGATAWTRELKARLAEYGAANGWWVLENPRGVPDEYTKILFSPNPHPGSDRFISLKHHIFYHAAPRENIVSIQKKGLDLRPHKQEGTYMDSGQFRVIYVADNPDSAIHVLRVKGYSLEDIAVFEINTSMLKVGTKFFQDPQFAHSYYTNSPIPAEALTLL